MFRHRPLQKNRWFRSVLPPATERWRTITINLTCDPAISSMSMANWRVSADRSPRSAITLKSDSPIFMIHNKKFVPKDLSEIDVVIFGHSHKYSEQEIDGRLWLNPGSCGKRRFDQEITLAILTVEGKTISVEKILIPHK